MRLVVEYRHKCHGCKPQEDEKTLNEAMIVADLTHQDFEEGHVQQCT